MAQIQFSLIKKQKLDIQNTRSKPLLRQITSHFCLNPPAPLKVDVICVSPLIKKVRQFSITTMCGKTIAVRN